MSQTADFLGYESAALQDAIFSIIPAPLEASITYVDGQSKAPRAIIDASSQVEDFDEETGLNVVDQGVHCLSAESAPTETFQLEEWIGQQMGAALDATAVPVMLGGESTITLWGVRNLLPKCDELSVLRLGAHAGLLEADEDEGEHHHTAMRQVLELGEKVHICEVGIRSLSRPAFDLIVDDEKPIECLFMSDIQRMTDESWHEDVIQELRSPVYLSIDMSVFDPSIVPAVGNPEPGGMMWWEVLRLLKKVASRRRIAAIDFVELCPREGEIRSDYATAKLVYKTMNYIFAGGKMLEKPAAE